MKKVDLVRALRDAEYRNSLTQQERAELNLAAVAEIDDEALQSVAGGCGVRTTFVSSCVRPPYNCP